MHPTPTAINVARWPRRCPVCQAVAAIDTMRRKSRSTLYICRDEIACAQRALA